jgi:hypothetical protein
MSFESSRYENFDADDCFDKLVPDEHIQVTRQRESDARVIRESDARAAADLRVAAKLRVEMHDHHNEHMRIQFEECGRRDEEARIRDDRARVAALEFLPERMKRIEADELSLNHGAPGAPDSLNDKKVRKVTEEIIRACAEYFVANAKNPNVVLLRNVAFGHEQLNFHAIRFDWWRAITNMPVSNFVDNVYNRAFILRGDPPRFKPQAGYRW